MFWILSVVPGALLIINSLVATPNHKPTKHKWSNTYTYRYGALVFGALLMLISCLTIAIPDSRASDNNNVSAARSFTVLVESLGANAPAPGVSGFGKISLDRNNTIIVTPTGGTERRYKVNLLSPNSNMLGSFSTDNKSWCFTELSGRFITLYNQDGRVSEWGGNGCLGGVAYNGDNVAVRNVLSGTGGRG